MERYCSWIFLDDLSMKLVSSSLQINFQSTRTEEWFLINSFIYLLCICRNLMKLENHFWTIQIDQMRTIGLLCSNYPTKSSQECSSHDLCSALGLRYDPMLLVLMTDSYLWVDEKAIYVTVCCVREVMMRVNEARKYLLQYFIELKVLHGLLINGTLQVWMRDVIAVLDSSVSSCMDFQGKVMQFNW